MHNIFYITFLFFSYFSFYSCSNKKEEILLKEAILIAKKDFELIESDAILNDKVVEKTILDNGMKQESLQYLNKSNVLRDKLAKMYNAIDAMLEKYTIKGLSPIFLDINKDTLFINNEAFINAFIFKNNMALTSFDASFFKIENNTIRYLLPKGEIKGHLAELTLLCIKIELATIEKILSESLTTRVLQAFPYEVAFPSKRYFVSYPEQKNIAEGDTFKVTVLKNSILSVHSKVLRIEIEDRDIPLNEGVSEIELDPGKVIFNKGNRATKEFHGRITAPSYSMIMTEYIEENTPVLEGNYKIKRLCGAQ